jgi:multidrug efflux pump subunit AcrB
MLTLATVVPGALTLKQLSVDLLPHLTYPNIRVRVLDPGVPARIMEDQVTRQVEEQLAITEGAVEVQSFTRVGRTAVDLSFPYGTDIDQALRDASARLDRAKRLLPDTIAPPIIYKIDPSQAPVLELVVSSGTRDTGDLFDWVDYGFSRSFINLPGVAAAEVGGGLIREIAIDVDPERLAAVGLTIQDLADLLADENRDATGGRLLTTGRELSARVAGRFRDLADIAAVPLRSGDDGEQSGAVLRLGELARVHDSHGAEQLRIRLDGLPGVKLSIQKQPQANTVAVVDAVMGQLEWMRDQGLIPADIQVKAVNDQSVFIRHALRNASLAAASGALLAMLVVYLFLGNLRRTLIVGTAIPVAILVTFVLMQAAGLSLNIMTLGGLALGIGILVDSTIVMLENIYRHQRQGEAGPDAAVHAATEVNSPIVASTTTNLAAVLPFLFIGGLTGLLFRELIFTISAAIAASMVVALTLVPALAGRVRAVQPGRSRRRMDAALERLQEAYGHMTGAILQRPWLPLVVLLPGLVWAVQVFVEAEDAFLPRVDNGQVRVRILGDSGMQLDEMDATVRRVEALLLAQPEVQSVFTQAGGAVYGRTQWFAGNRSVIRVQLTAQSQRTMSTEHWVQGMRERIQALDLAGFRVSIWARGKVPGIRLGRGDDDLSLRIAGPDLTVLARLGQELVERLRGVQGLDNLSNTYEGAQEGLDVSLDRARASALEVTVDEVSQALQVALDGLVVTDYLDGDRRYDVRLRLPRGQIASADALDDVIVDLRAGRAIRLRDMAEVILSPSPANIMRDRQMRVVEVSASIQEGYALDQVMDEVNTRLAGLELPPGYGLYDDGAVKALKQGQRLGYLLLALAIFLVFVVMAVQYESLRNPLVILFAIPFTLIGVAGGLWYSALPLSMPVWLGMIMLAGIVVNNGIVLVEQIEIERARGGDLNGAIRQAARLRLRPILMTTLTTVVGMTPLALGLGEGSEMLQPLAVVIVWGLSFSTLVSLVLIPTVYRLLQGARPEAGPEPAPAG